MRSDQIWSLKPLILNAVRILKSIYVTEYTTSCYLNILGISCVYKIYRLCCIGWRECGIGRHYVRHWPALGAVLAGTRSCIGRHSVRYWPALSALQHIYWVKWSTATAELQSTLAPRQSASLDHSQRWLQDDRPVWTKWQMLLPVIEIYSL